MKTRFTGGIAAATLLAAQAQAPAQQQEFTAIDTLDGRCVLAASTHRDGMDPLRGRSSYALRFAVPALPIATGSFHLYAFLLDESGLYNHDQVILTDAVRFSAPEWTPSLISLEHRWERR